jgi:nucleoside-diphosphate-sugar epimerase
MNELIENDLDYILGELSSQEKDFYSGGRLLISGGAGFIGYYLIQAFLRGNKSKSFKDPVEVILLDNFIRGIPDWIREYSTDPYLKIFQLDITKPLPEDIGSITHVIHAASIASPTFYRKYPIETMDANVNGLRNLLEHFKHDTNLKGFLFFSSSEVYGNPTPENIPTPEDYYGNVSFTGPRACYDESKRFGETLAVNFSHAYNMPVKIVRPFNNYGPGLKISDRRVIPDFATNIMESEDIIILSDGSATRTFCYISDAVVGYLKVLARGRSGESYNIGKDKPEISVNELADICVSVAKDLFHYTGKTVKKSSSDNKYLVDNPVRRCPDISKARNELGFEPDVGIEDGLRKTFLWYEYQRKKGVEL